MKNWSMKKQLVFFAGSLMAMILLGQGVAFWNSKALVERLHDISDVQLPGVRQMTLTDMMHDGLRAVAFRALLNAKNPTQEVKEEINGELKEMSDNIRTYLDELNKLDIRQETKEKIAAAKPSVEAYVAACSNITEKALAGKESEALALVPELQVAFEQLEGDLGALGELIEKDAEKSCIRKSARRRKQL